MHNEINLKIKESEVDTNLISDGYHTFGELYDHRIILYLSLLSAIKNDPKFDVWYSDTHDNDSKWDGWLIVGINDKITYHINSSYEHYLISMGIKFIERAPKWDGHTSADVLERLINAFILGGKC